MVRRITTFLLASLMVAAAQQARAEGESCACPIQTALKKLPQLEFQVAAHKTSCDKTAAELSEKEGVPIKYVAGTRAFETQAAAMLVLAEQTEALVAQFATPKQCEVSGTIAVGGKTLQCSEKAAATAKMLQKAIDTVSVSYKVGEKECHCPIEAKTLAAKSTESIVFCVGGKETGCPVEHRLNTARAQYRAAVETLAQMDN